MLTCLLPQFLSLASSILNFVTTSMLKSRNNFIRNYLSVSLTEQHMATLASIIKDVDKDVKGVLCKMTDIFLFFLLGLPPSPLPHTQHAYQANMSGHYFVYDVMFSFIDRLLRWGVFFSSVPFQSHSGYFRPSLSRPAGNKPKSIWKYFCGNPLFFRIVFITYTCLHFSRIHFFSSWASLPFQRVLGPCIFILSHCQCSPGFSSFGSTKPQCRENQMCLSVWKSGKGILFSLNLPFTSFDKQIIL